MKYIVRGGKSVSLGTADFIFQGGEGRIYGKGDTAYKIYDDISKMIPDAKIRELSVIDHPAVVRPEAVLLDGKNRPAGFTMRWVRRAVPLVKLFTSAFRSRHRIGDDRIYRLVAAMREAVAAVHGAGCVMVDGNEFNYLVDEAGFDAPCLIDVNAYQTPSFPATVIMPSIRDPKAAAFTELSDWFAFGIVACQLFVGIHPFRGRHPEYTKKRYGGEALARRMADGVSIFDPKVSVPPAARDFSVIPKNYMEWFRALFQEGLRLPPPERVGAAPAPDGRHRVIHSTAQFQIRRVRSFDSAVRYHRAVFGQAVTRTEAKLYFGKAELVDAGAVEVIFSPRRLRPVLARMDGENVRFSAPPDANWRVRGPVIAAAGWMVADNTLFLRGAESLIEMAAVDRPDGDVAVAVRSTLPIMPHASQMYDGVVIQDALGRPYAVIPLPRPDGPSAYASRPLKELIGHRVIDARYENRALMVLSRKGDAYRRHMFRFDPDHGAYDCRIEDDVQPADGVNFTALENGIVVAIDDENRIQVFTNRRGDDRMDVIADPDIPPGLRLCRDGLTMLGFRGADLYAIRRLKG